MAHILHLVLAIALLAFAPADAFFFFFDWPGETSACQVVDLTWRKADGQPQPVPPFQAVVVPVFSQPFVYDIPDSAYNGNSGSYPIALQLPAGSNYVVYISDGHGRYTGGSSQIQTVKDSSDTSCLATTSANQSSLEFTFTVSGHTKQCQAGFETSWSGGVEDGPYNMTVVPLDSSFYPFDVVFDTNLRYQSSWVVNITQGSKFTVFMNNARGYGHGGSAGVYAVAPGDSKDCISQPMAPTGSWPVQIATNSLDPATLPITSTTSATSTGSSTGSSTTTSHSPSPSPNGNGGSPPIGAIAGGAGVVIALILLAFLLFVCRRRRRKANRPTPPPDDIDAFDDRDLDSHAMIDPYRPLTYPAPGSGSLADQAESSHRYSTSTFTSALVAGLGLVSPHQGYDFSDIGSSTGSREAEPRPIKGEPAPQRPPSHPKAGEAGDSFRSDSSSGSGVNLITFSPGQPRGALQIINHDAEDEANMPVLPPGAAHGNGNGDGRRRNRVIPSGPVPPGGFRRHADAGRLDSGENAPVASGEIIDLPPTYSEVPRGG